jgi:hypothetical protein
MLSIFLFWMSLDIQKLKIMQMKKLSLNKMINKKIIHLFSNVNTEIINQTYATDSAIELIPDKSFQKLLLYPSDPANTPTISNDVKSVMYLDLS